MSQATHPKLASDETADKSASWTGCRPRPRAPVEQQPFEPVTLRYSPEVSRPEAEIWRRGFLANERSPRTNASGLLSFILSNAKLRKGNSAKADPTRSTCVDFRVGWSASSSTMIEN